MLVSVLVAWAIWQPESSQRSVDRGLDRASAGDYQGAVRAIDDGARADRLSPAPLLALADVQSAARLNGRAERTLELAVVRFPGDPETWTRLARFQLANLDDPRAALRTVRGLLYLDPYSPIGRQLYLSSRSALRLLERER
jgi:hypothetical protein